MQLPESRARDALGTIVRPTFDKSKHRLQLAVALPGAAPFSQQPQNDNLLGANAQLVGDFFPSRACTAGATSRFERIDSGTID